MPQLSKGGKWVFDRIVVGPRKRILLPHTIYSEYYFQTNEALVFTRDSRRSSKFDVGKRAKVTALILQSHIIEEGVMGKQLWPTMDTIAGEQFLMVRGNHLVLSFIKHGPSVDLALRQSEIKVFAL
jgi:hypothetical protein